MLMAGHAMRQARAPLLCSAGAWLGLAQAVFLVIRLGSLNSLHGGLYLGPSLRLVSAAVPVALFCAGLWALGVLSRPGVQAVLARSAPPPHDDD